MQKIRAFRQDACTAVMDAQRTPEGYLRGTASISSSGIFKYEQADGTILRELRHPNQVFRADSLASFKLLPVQIEHNAMLDSRNMSRFKTGHMGEDVHVDAPFVKNTVVLDDERAVKAYDGGKREFSCGYYCNLVMQKGVYDGEEFDAIQMDIEGNHLALCDTARLGPDMKFDGARMDSTGKINVAIRTDSNPKPRTDSSKENPMINSDLKKIKLDSIPGCSEKFDGEYEVPAYLSLYFDKMKITLDAANKRADAAEAERDQLRGQKQTLDSKLASYDKDVEAAAQTRAAIIADAKERVDETTATKLDAMSNKEIKIAVIKTVDSETDLATKSEEYLDAAYAMATKAGKVDGAAETRKQNGTKVPEGDGGAEDFNEQFASKRRDSITNSGKKE